MKKLLSITLSIVMVLSVLTLIPTVSAKTKKYKSQNCIYTLDKKGNATVLDYAYSKDDNIDSVYWKIPAKLNGHKVTKLDIKEPSECFNFCKTIKIPKTVNSIYKGFVKEVNNCNNNFGFLFTVTCDKNSFAHKYAVKNKLVYKLTGDNKFYGDICILLYGISYKGNTVDGNGMKAYNSKGEKLIRTGDLCGNYTYNDKNIKPQIVLKNKGTKLKKNKDYTLSYAHNSEVGKGFVFVKGKGNYSGVVAFEFYIKPKQQKIESLSKVDDTSIKIVSDVPMGYSEIQYSEVADFSTKTTIKEVKTEWNTVNNLQKGKTYYFRLRNYVYMPDYYIMKVTDENNYTVCRSWNTNLYGAWSEVKSITL